MHVCLFTVDISKAAWGLVRWSALVGGLSILESAFWGFPLLLALLHLFPVLCLFVTRYSRSIDVFAFK